MQLALELGRVFTPAAPVSEQDLFAGRQKQLREVIDAVLQRGQHVVIFGERGVGKTSLVNVLAQILSREGQHVIAPRVNGDASDTFSSLMHKVFLEVSVSEEQEGVGFEAKPSLSSVPLADKLPSEITPIIARQTLNTLGSSVLTIVIIDEFDQVSDKASRDIANFIKALSDYSIPVTMVLVGVANSVDELVRQHESVERALVQIQMPRMSTEEIEEIINKGMERLDLTIENQALKQIQLLAQGLPHYAHLLGYHCVRLIGDRDQRHVTTNVVREAIRNAGEGAQQSIRSAYSVAVRSPRKESLFAQVLLACALAPTDDLGLFTPASVKSPMSTLMGKPYEIPSFSRHLNNFTAEERGYVLERVGEPRRYRYRFRNPLMQPYVIMRGLSDGLIDAESLDHLTKEAGLQRA